MVDLLLDIEECISAGRPKDAQSKIKIFLKKARLTTEERIRLSEVYRSLSENEKALKILGEELSPHEMVQISESELAVQIRLAYMLQYLGVRYVAERMFKTFEAVAEQRQLKPEKLVPLYYRYLTGHHLGRNDYSKAIITGQKAMVMLKNDLKAWKASAINLGAALFSLRRYDECEEHFNQLIKTNPQDSIFIGECHQRLADLYLDQDKLDQAFWHIEKALPLLQVTTTVDYIFIYRSLAIYNIKKGNKAAALSALMMCEKFPYYDQIVPLVRISISFWKENLSGNAVPVRERLGARTHLTYSPYSHALGKSYPVNAELPLRTFFGTTHTPKGHDIWMIHDQTIEGTTYDQAIKRLHGTILIYDLVSGILINPQGRPETVWTSLQSITISALMGAGSLGLSKWALIDFLYRQNFFNPKSGEERLKKIISALKKIGFAVGRENNLYSLDLPSGAAVIMSMNHTFKGPLSYLLAFNKVLTRPLLENTFKIKTSTAKQWLNDWEKTGSISRFGKGKSIHYIKADILQPRT
ncbi:MAG: tetratricopeptide repeat protein [Bdellovibrio sp.]|nr:tetratricopeptide repeat protein [Bdellovibrio sp.]